MANLQRDPAKEVFWRAALVRHAASGLSARQFCQRERLTESAFYFWRRTLRERDAQIGRTVSARPASSTERRKAKQPAFVPAIVNRRVVDSETPRETPLTIELNGGVVLRMPGISVEKLADLIVALERRSP
jgi:transposase-like protein